MFRFQILPSTPPPKNEKQKNKVPGPGPLIYSTAELWHQSSAKPPSESGHVTATDPIHYPSRPGTAMWRHFTKVRKSFFIFLGVGKREKMEKVKLAQCYDVSSIDSIDL